eukprot:6255356-Prymnesium_polylepis.1
MDHPATRARRLPSWLLVLVRAASPDATRAPGGATTAPSPSVGSLTLNAGALWRARGAPMLA